jgi:hypothetical protein
MNEKPILFSTPMVNAILDDRKWQTRRIVTPKRCSVFLPRRVYADPMLGRGKINPRSAPRGRHAATLHADGAVSVALHDGPLGVEPGEFEWRCPYAEGSTMLRDGKWIITPKPDQALWVRETWGYGDRYYREFDEKGGPGTVVAYLADHSAMMFGETPKRVPKYDIEQWNWSRMRWRPSIFLPRWACRILLDVREVRIERLQDITEDDAYAEGVPTSLTLAGESCRAAYARLWDTINPKTPWKSNPWVWVISFSRLHRAAWKVAS